MLKYKKIKVGKKHIEALVFKLFDKNIIILKGGKGYVMCGYLNMKAAEQFHDAAVKITGVSDIKGALLASVYSCTAGARKLGIHKGQAISEVLRLIA